jgi:pre-mRNA-splicing helicase BRR2
MADEVVGILSESNERDCENRLVVLLDYDKFDFIKLLLRNRAKVMYCTRLKQAQTKAERSTIEEEMREDVAGGGPAILSELKSTQSAESWTANRMEDFALKARQEARTLGADGEAKNLDIDGAAGAITGATAEGVGGARPSGTVDLDSLGFTEGSRFMSQKRIQLPPNPWRKQEKEYEEVHIPGVKKPLAEGQTLVPISDLPEWSQKGFAGCVYTVGVRLVHCWGAACGVNFISFVYVV